MKARLMPLFYALHPHGRYSAAQRTKNDRHAGACAKLVKITIRNIKYSKSNL